MLSLALVTNKSPLAMKVAEQLLEIHISLIHEVVIAWLYGYEAHSLGVMDRGFRQINKCGNRSPQIQQGMHPYTTFIMMKSCPWTELQAKFHRTAVKGKDDSVHIESGRLVAVQVSRLCNQYLTGELGKTHHHELIFAFKIDGMSVAIVSLYAFVELISRYERHYLSEYGLFLIHDFYLMQYNLQNFASNTGNSILA
jgi:hypothetical protein